MSDDCDYCVCILVCAVLAFIVLTFGSPIFILYGFFSTQWMILDKDQGNKTDIGLYKRCQHGECSSEVFDDAAFGLMVVSVMCLFLSVLALPWLKSCYPDSTCLRYWNLCFLPLLFVSAVLSLAASTYFLNKYKSSDENVTLGSSQVCAGLGGGFQIVLVVVIGCCIYLYANDDDSSAGQVISSDTSQVHEQHHTTVTKTQSYIVSFFYFEAHTPHGTVTAAQVEAHAQEEYQVQQQAVEYKRY